MSKPVHEVAHIINSVNDQLPGIVSNAWKRRTLYAVSRCRTAAMGGHIDRCDNPTCNRLHLSYNSCRNRHCPKCQGHLKEAWIQKREAELLEVPYFHVVFTLPDSLNELCLQQPDLLYNMLFSCAWQVISGFGENHKFLGAKAGMIAILHTWGSNMSLHPHLHCIVPAGGINGSGKWKTTKSKGKYLFPVKSMSKVFRAKFLDELNENGCLDSPLYDQLVSKKWVVYAKRPFGGPMQVVKYLGRYTHKIAISNHRITDVGTDQVSFQVKDYRKGGRKRECVLTKAEFIRRFAMHILNRGFTRIRHFGLLSATGKKKYLDKIREQIPAKDSCQSKADPVMVNVCPHCKKGKLVIVEFFTSDRAPPSRQNQQILQAIN